MLCFTFNGLLFQHSSAQDKVDSESLALSSLINYNDRIGQLNHLFARSRELVYASRERLAKCEQDELDFLRPLCSDLLDEARAGNLLLEQERKQQIQVICAEIQNSAKFSNSKAQSNNSIRFGALKTDMPQIWKIEVGQIKNVQSSMKCGQSLAKLASHDKSQNYFMPKSHLFRSGVNAKLPGPDADLDFKFTALPACVENTCMPARNANSDVFVYQGTIYDEGEVQAVALSEIPCALRVISRMNAELDGKQKLSMPLTSVGTTGGAACDYSN